MPQNDPLTSSVETEPGPAWGSILAYGVLVVLIGSLALGNPLATGLATGFLLGVMLLTYGLVALISGLSSLSKRGRWIEALLGLLGVAAGGFVLFAPFAGALSLVWAIGFWLFVAGILELVSAIKGSHDRGWRFALGLLDIVLGGFLLFSGPASSLVFLAGIVGISFLFRGVFLIILALGLRRLSRSL